MNKKLIGSLILGTILMAYPLSAQKSSVPRTLTIEEYTAGNPKTLHAQSIPALQWLGNDYIYVDGARLVIGKPGKAVHERTLLTNKELESIVGSESAVFRGKYFSRFSIVDVERGLMRIATEQAAYIINPKTKTLVATIPNIGGTVAEELNSSYSHLAFVKEHNIEIQSLKTREGNHRITTDGSEQIVYGQSVHQNEFGISGGLFWSPDGRKLAFYRMDQSMVQPYPILHVNARKPYAESQYYPMAGLPIHHVTIGVYNLDTRETIYLATGEPKEKYLTNVCWSPDSRELFVAEVNREQTRNELKVYSPQTGKLVRNVFVEENSVYIEPRFAPRFVPGHSNQFVWQSRRDGYDHLYLYNTDGTLIRQLTKGNWEVVDFHGFSPDGKQLYYTSTEGSPLDRNLYSVTLNKAQRKVLTPAYGWHTPRLSADKKFVIDFFESPEVARRIDLVSHTGKALRTMLLAKHPEKDFTTPNIELGTIKAADGKTDLHYRIIKPTNFDPNKRYPTIVYVYNGPHAQLVQRRYRAAARGWDLHMATQGFVVFTVDGRGSAYRGAEFEQVIHRNIGKNEMADQMCGVDFLRTLPYVDANRIGVYGWSYGGFMTTNLMLTHPDVFKVGVAGGGVMDWSRYEAMYGERYMDTPQENPEGYKANNLLSRAGDLKGRLLLIHGTIDPVVIWQHTMLFVDACVKAGSLPDYMIYPEHQHNVIGPDRVHLNKVITRYFQDHL